MRPEQVDGFLRATGLHQGPVRVTALKGGYTNQVLEVETGPARLVLKCFSAATTGTLFPNLPADEARALGLLGPLGVAPQLLGFWPDQSVMAYPYVPGDPWVAGTAEVARLLLAKEAASPEGFRAVPLTPAAILAEGDALFARCTAQPPAPRPAPVDLPAPARLSLLHTDLGPGNLIGQGAGLRIIDWQCPAAGDLVEDIYSFLSPAFQILSQHAPLMPAERVEFWGTLARPDLYRRYLALRPFYAWRMAGYCLWRSETRPEADVRDRYAKALAAETPHLDPRHAD